MILPPDGDMWEGKRILGNPRRRIHQLTDISKLWEAGVKQAHEAQRAYERHNLWGAWEIAISIKPHILCKIQRMLSQHIKLRARSQPPANNSSQILQSGSPGRSGLASDVLAQ